ncbi:hypothetical protein HQN64_14725 [Enterobacteriaceae bacterium BIT-l23]|uniref:glycosyltransferase family protein n=1 Tax=Jejubacter sp. L23 TaxID=3092086 RepID=UPI001584C13D|nr:hypothetical protein [Enterobacteriaceae bacterium BIT-l23]
MESVLLICPTFYNYREIIKVELERQGNSVVAFDERPSNDTWFKIALRLLGAKPLLPITRRYYRDKISQIETPQNIGLILIVNPEAMDKIIIDELRRACPNARIVIYLWDSLRNKRYISELFRFCDKVFTFDYDDAKSKMLEFLPLFFTVSSRGRTTVKPKKIVFIGSIHSTRLKTIAFVNSLAMKERIKFSFSLYFPSRIIYAITYIKSGVLRKQLGDHVILKPLPYDEYLHEMSSSEFVLDIAHPKQTGLTMRTLEAIAFNKKIITTNDNIKNYDFYEPDKHFILTKENEHQLVDFIQLSSPECYYPQSVLNKYSISNWVARLLERE